MWNIQHYVDFSTVSGYHDVDVDRFGLDEDLRRLRMTDPAPLSRREREVMDIVHEMGVATANDIRLNANTGSDECAGSKVDCTGGVWLADFGYNQAASAFTCNYPGAGESCVISNIDTIFGCENEETDDEAQQVFGREDYRDPEGASGRDVGV